MERWRVVAAAQLKLITVAQAKAAGLGRVPLHRLVRRGELESAAHRVYRIVDGEPSFQQRLMAQQLRFGPQACITHRAAARLHGLEVDGDVTEVTAPSVGVTDPRFALHRGLVPQADVRLIGPLRVTSKLRTLIDLAACVSELDLAIAVESAWRKHGVAPAAVLRRLTGWGGWREPNGAVKLRGVLNDCIRRGRPLRSGLEVMMWRLLLSSGLPQPKPLYWVSDADGSRREIDFAYPKRRLAIETHGKAYHGTSAEQFEHDCDRHSALGTHWRLQHVTKKQLREQPEVVLDRIRTALALRWRKAAA